MEKLNANYSIQEIFRLGYSYILTRIFWKDARIVRYPHQIRGRKSIRFGKNFSAGYEVLVDICYTDKIRLRIGDNCDLGNYNHITVTESVTIGNNFLTGSNVLITDTEHGNYSDNESCPDVPPKERCLFTKPVIIGNNVWIGEKATVLPGVTIGDGCIIGANSVITHSIPSNCIVVGNPQRIIKIWDESLLKWKKV